MTFVDRSIARIRRAIKRAPSNLAFAKAAGVPDTVLRDALEDHWNPTANTMRKLERAARDGSGDGANEGHRELAG